MHILNVNDWSTLVCLIEFSNAISFVRLENGPNPYRSRTSRSALLAASLVVQTNDGNQTQQTQLYHGGQSTS